MIRFALVADHHYGAYNFNGLSSDGRMALMVSKLNEESQSSKGLDFSVHMGDLVNDQPNDLPAFKTHLDSLISPYHIVHGNHDATPETQWQSVWGQSSNYSFTYGDYGFIVLNNFATNIGLPWYVHSCVNDAWLQAQFDAFYAKRSVFVLTHYLQIGDCPGTAAILASAWNYRGLFHGHWHTEDKYQVNGVWWHSCGHWSVYAGGVWNNAQPYTYRIVEIDESNDYTYTYQFNPEYQYPWGFQAATVVQDTVIQEAGSRMRHFHWPPWSVVRRDSQGNELGLAASPDQVTLRDSGGTEIATATDPVRVDPTGTTVQPVSIDHTTPGTTDRVESRPFARRNAGFLHRNGITAVDKLATAGAPGTADNGPATGSLNFNTTYRVAVSAGNRWGQSVTSTVTAQATANDALATHSIRATIAQVAGADHYDLFLSTAATPLWVARVTEAQRAAGDFEVTAVGTVAAGGGNPAGTIDINVVGTGIATNNAVFASNNAYTPASVAAVSCAGRSRAHILVKLTLTDLRSAPSLAIVPFLANQLSANDWHQAAIQTLVLVNGTGSALLADFTLDVDGSTGLVVLVDTIGGQGASVQVWVELA